MERIPEIDLVAEAKAVESEILEQKKNEIRKKIHFVVGEYTKSKGSIRDLEDKLAKAKKSLEGTKNKYDAIMAGNWDVLRDEPRNEQKKVEEAA